MSHDQPDGFPQARRLPAGPALRRVLGALCPGRRFGLSCIVHQSGRPGAFFGAHVRRLPLQVVPRHDGDAAPAQQLGQQFGDAISAPRPGRSTSVGRLQASQALDV
jgi:hypothetical protein